MKITVFHLIEQHNRLLKKRERAVRNVEYPWNNNDTTIKFVEELQNINDEINDFLNTELEMQSS